MDKHYFPPNPTKLGDSLLTLDIADEFAAEGGEVTYYSTRFVSEVVRAVAGERFRYKVVDDVRAGAEAAAKLRMTAPAAVLDLLRLNCWVDYPELAHLFGEVPARARLAWFDERAVKQYGLWEFTAIFRQMLGMGPRRPLSPPPWRQSRRYADLCVIAPHCETDFQQLEDWDVLAGALLAAGWRVVAVGREIVRTMFRWPLEVELALDLTGQQLVGLLRSAGFFIGGATGITHLADTLGVPALGLWKVDDRRVFGPRRPTTATLVTGSCEAVLHVAVARPPTAPILTGGSPCGESPICA